MEHEPSEDLLRFYKRAQFSDDTIDCLTNIHSILDAEDLVVKKKHFINKERSGRVNSKDCSLLVAAATYMESADHLHNFTRQTFLQYTHGPYPCDYESKQQETRHYQGYCTRRPIFGPDPLLPLSAPVKQMYIAMKINMYDQECLTNEHEIRDSLDLASMYTNFRDKKMKGLTEYAHHILEVVAHYIDRKDLLDDFPFDQFCYPPNNECIFVSEKKIVYNV
jgi:hypothetical protein